MPLTRNIWLSILIAACLQPAAAKAQLRTIRRLQQELPMQKDSNAYVNTINKLGLLFYLKSWDSCLYYAREAQTIAERQHYQPGIAAALNVLGVYHMSENNYLAAKYLNESLQLYTQLADSANIAQLYNNLGIIFFLDNNKAVALPYFKHADEISRHLQNDSIRSIILANLTEVDSTIVPKAVDSMLAQAGSIALKYRDTLMLHTIRLQKASLAFSRQKSSATIDSLVKIFSELEEDENNFQLAAAYTGFADGMMAAGNKQTALQYYNKALEKANANKNYPIYAIILEKLMSYYASVGNPARAYEYASRLLAEKNRLNDRLKNSGYNYVNYVLNEKDLEQATEKAAGQKKIIIISAILLVVFLVLLIVLYRFYTMSRRSGQIQQQLAESTRLRNAQLESWNEFNTTLLGIMAHDLRQPFTTIVSVAQLTRQGSDLTMEEMGYIMEALRETSQQSIQFIDGLLCWVKSKREDFAYHPTAVLVKEAVAQADVFFVADQQKKNITLETTIPPALTVSADTTMLLFILRNLLNNATKYAPANSRIKVSASAGDNTVQISVADEGKGMPAETLKQLFSVRPNSAPRNDNLKGAGLALVISQDMVKQMNGTLVAESKEGEGAVFHLVLPQHTDN